jgi:hypothetical protein
MACGDILILPISDGELPKLNTPLYPSVSHDTNLFFCGTALISGLSEKCSSIFTWSCSPHRTRPFVGAGALQCRRLDAFVLPITKMMKIAPPYKSCLVLLSLLV